MAGTLRRTPLYDRHVGLGARMAPFAGWEMPIQYEGVREEHRAVRDRCGVFDVSHMGQIVVSGGDGQAFLGRMLSNDVTRLTPGGGQYTLLCRDDGGVIDDLIVYRTGEQRHLIVCNAANVEPVTEWLRRHITGAVELTDESTERAMLAIQGRGWEAAIAPIAGDAAERVVGLGYFDITPVTLAGVECVVARTGYTGEPGVEVMCAAADAPALWDALMAGPDAPTPAGLAARDTLRLEMGYPLYGQELSLDRTPIEAGLGWACALDREFVGADALRERVAAGTPERLVMFELSERGIPRTGCGVLAGDETVGTVTSGTLSPTADVGFGLAYVRSDLAVVGTPITIDIRGKHKAAVIRKRPLIDTSPKGGD